MQDGAKIMPMVNQVQALNTDAPELPLTWLVRELVGDSRRTGRPCLVAPIWPASYWVFCICVHCLVCSLSGTQCVGFPI